LNKDLDSLSQYPFYFLSKLLNDGNKVEPNSVNLSIGEPKHSPPQECLDIINEESKALSQYPTSKGIDRLRDSYERWLKRRFNIEPQTNLEQCVLPLGGTREGIFSFMQACIDRGQKNPTVIVPNPFYKIYEGAAKMAGAECFYLNSEKKNDFRPDFNSIPEEVLENCQLLILCSPSNPTGYCLTKEDYSEAIKLANEYNFIICSDECYVDIYPSHKEAPLGLLEFLEFNEADPKYAVFHSLSKRSNLAGLRSGFIVGSEELIEKVLLYRTYHGVTIPIPSQKASCWAWEDEMHVERNRLNYDKKYDLSLEIFSDFPQIKRPKGSFYFWIETPCSDEEFTKALYEKEKVIVLPGSYLGQKSLGINPGHGFIRVAVVHGIDIVEKSMISILNVLNSY
tara:strand:- start:1039 stop:2226 length:1188 start_codon:yes stop_codon:yes gene_type:complete